MLRVHFTGFRSKLIRYKYGRKIKRYTSPSQFGLLALQVLIIAGLSSFVLKPLVLGQYSNYPDKQNNQHSSTTPTDNKNGTSKPNNQDNKPNNSLADKYMVNNPRKTLPKPFWTTLPLYTDPYNSAAQHLPTVIDPKEASNVSKMSQIPVAQWFGDWNNDVTEDVALYTNGATANNSVPVVVAYNIPNRDCGGYSIGGAFGVDDYLQWVQKLADGISTRTAVVILEPDALGALDCLPSNTQSSRTDALAKAVSILKQKPKISVYIDAGTPVWQPLDVMAQRLTKANIAEADGFSLNVSYFASTQQNKNYGDKLSSLVGDKHYVIDTSRNGANVKVTGMQCNPPFAAFGEAPTTNTKSQLVDAFLWIKIPWESDGACNGSPGPGVSYWSYAFLLAQNAGW